MIQEIKINLTITLEGEVSRSKQDIQSFINDMMINVNATKAFSLQGYKLNRIQEEAEIYSPEMMLKNDVWDFVEMYYPDYYSCNEIMRNDDLCKIVNMEFDGDRLNELAGGVSQNYELAVTAFDQSTKYIYERAIMGYQQSLENKIAIVWSIEDVEQRAIANGYLLKEGEALKVLAMLKEKHDCKIGINWDTIDAYLISFMN